jgi:hypothetical protein
MCTDGRQSRSYTVLHSVATKGRTVPPWLAAFPCAVDDAVVVLVVTLEVGHRSIHPMSRAKRRSGRKLGGALRERPSQADAVRPAAGSRPFLLEHLGPAARRCLARRGASDESSHRRGWGAASAAGLRADRRAADGNDEGAGRDLKEKGGRREKKRL